MPQALAAIYTCHTFRVENAPLIQRHHANTMTTAPPRILYIAGYGRSGSTVLAAILGNHPEMVSIGEIAFFADDLQSDNRLCSCGEKYETCRFWGGLLADFTLTGANAALSHRIEKYAAVHRLRQGRITPAERDAYRSYQRHILEYAQQQRGARWVIDSSKSAWRTTGRFVALQQLAGLDVYVLHLVRSGWATLESLVLTGRNWALEGHVQPPRRAALKATVGWTVANVRTAQLKAALPPDRYLLLRYEDFIDQPAAALDRIGRFCNLDLAPLSAAIEQEQSFVVGHMVGGNRLRLQGQVQLRRGRGMSDPRRLKLHQHVLFHLIGGWLERHYGY